MLARVYRLVGARVKFNAYLRDMNVSVRTAHRGVGPRLAVFQRSPACSQHHPPWCHEPRRTTAPTNRRCGRNRAGPRWTRRSIQNSWRRGAVVMAIESGGKWSDEAADFVWQMAQAREVLSIMSHFLRGVVRNVLGGPCRAQLQQANQWIDQT